jgi:predicted GNAT family N-acyltransferase
VIEELAFTVLDATWEKDGNSLLAVRTPVFVEGQGVPVEIEQDGRDGECWHALATDRSGEPIGAGRLSPEGKIGRVAVLEEWRGRGVGVALMRCLLARADAEGLAETYLHSQVDAAGFYERLGFQAVGEEFEEAAIKHVKMVRKVGAGDRL